MHACPFDYQLELSTFLSRSPFSKLSDAFSVYFKRREFPSLDPRKRNPSSHIHICSKKNVHLNTSVFNNEKKLSLHHFISYHQSQMHASCTMNMYVQHYSVYFTGLTLLTHDVRTLAADLSKLKLRTLLIPSTTRVKTYLNIKTIYMNKSLAITSAIKVGFLRLLKFTYVCICAWLKYP